MRKTLHRDSARNGTLTPLWLTLISSPYFSIRSKKIEKLLLKSTESELENSRRIFDSRSLNVQRMKLSLYFIECVHSL